MKAKRAPRKIGRFPVMDNTVCLSRHLSTADDTVSKLTIPPTVEEEPGVNPLTPAQPPILGHGASWIGRILPAHDCAYEY